MLAAETESAMITGPVLDMTGALRVHMLVNWGKKLTAGFSRKWNLRSIILAQPITTIAAALELGLSAS